MPRVSGMDVPGSPHPGKKTRGRILCWLHPLPRTLPSCLCNYRARALYSPPKLGNHRKYHTTTWGVKIKKHAVISNAT